MTNKTDISNVASLELGSLMDSTTLFQKEMYFTDLMYNSYIKGINYGQVESKDNEEVPSQFFNKIKKQCMAVDMIDRMTVTPGSDGELTYGINDKMDFLLYIYMIRKFPKLKVKEEFKDLAQICWTHNLGHNSIIRLDMMIDDNPKQTLTNTTLDVNSQFFMKPGFKKSYRKMTGDSKYMQEWKNELDSINIKVPLPLFFSRKRSVAFPIFLAIDDNKLKSKIEFKLNYRTNISDLLKMRIRQDIKSEWHELPYNWNLIQGITDGEQKLPNPEFIACYSKVTDEEKNGWKEQINNTENKVYKMYYDDFIIINPDRSFNNKDPFTEDLISKTPCRAIYWVAQNQEGLKYNNYSNYTTDVYDNSKGKDPITKISLKYGGSMYRFNNMDSHQFIDIMNYYKFPSVPYSPGFQAFCFSSNITGTDTDIGPVFGLDNKSSLTLSLDDDSNNKDNSTISGDKSNLINSLISNNNKPESSSGQRYKIYVLLQCMKKIEFTPGDKVRVNDGNDKIRL